MKQKCKAKVKDNIKIADGIYDIRLETDLAAYANPGQFVGVYTSDASALLPRPISICEAEVDRKCLRLVYRVVGKGTDWLSKKESGEEVDILGILGNGYDLSTADEKKEIILMAGGIGVPPMVELAKKLSVDHKVSAVIGYRNSETFLLDDLKKYADVYIATDDGSVGFKGNAVDALGEYKLNPDIIYACGPMPMLRAIKRYAEEHGIEAYISLEERMACGVGACLGCVCKTVHKDHHSHVNNARICTDGPVFEAGEVDI
jgi:dihydroorotate dehydrogenase electron transfer subunit